MTQFTTATFTHPNGKPADVLPLGKSILKRMIEDMLNHDGKLFRQPDSWLVWQADGTRFAFTLDREIPAMNIAFGAF